MDNGFIGPHNDSMTSPLVSVVWALLLIGGLVMLVRAIRSGPPEARHSDRHREQALAEAVAQDGQIGPF